MLRDRIQEVRRHPDAGYTTETVLVTALLVILALAVLGFVATKVLAKAHSIDLGFAPW